MRFWLAVSLLAAAVAAAPTSARADNDAVHFLSDIHVAPGAPVHDAVCFLCDVRNDGQVTGDIVTFFGNVHISGEAQHDVVSFFGNVDIDDNVAVRHDLVSFFGNVRMGENASVGHDMVSFFGAVHAPASAHVGQDRVSIPGIVFYGPFLFIIAAIVLIAYEIRSRRNRWLAGYPPPPVQ